MKALIILITILIFGCVKNNIKNTNYSPERSTAAKESKDYDSLININTNSFTFNLDKTISHSEDFTLFCNLNQTTFEKCPVNRPLVDLNEGPNLLEISSSRESHRMIINVDTIKPKIDLVQRPPKKITAKENIFVKFSLSEDVKKIEVTLIREKDILYRMNLLPTDREFEFKTNNNYRGNLTVSIYAEDKVGHFSKLLINLIVE